MKIVVVGAGTIGKERIKALREMGQDVIIVDPNIPCYHDDLETVLDREDWIDWIFICTPHHVTPEVAKIAYSRSFNVLCEKPLGRTVAEYNEIIKNRFSRSYNVGFNYRFLKGVRQLLTDCKEGIFGDLVSVNMILALGDAPGCEKTWRLDPECSGRGALLDPGIHLIDIAMLISNDTLRPISHRAWSGFWNTGIDEEAHLLAIDNNDTIYNIQASVCHWRNAFGIEVNGTEGYGIVEGRNRFYGPQTYRRGRRWGWQSGKSQRDSEELVVDYDGEDSFFEETRAVLFGCEGIQPGANEDNRRCLEFIESL